MYAGNRDLRDPMMSPLFADLSGLPPLLIHVGGDEVLVDDSRLLAERARAAGVVAEYTMWPGMWHVHQNDAPEVPEAVDATEAIGAFVKASFGDEAK